MAKICDMCGKLFSEDAIVSKDGKCHDCWRKLFPPEPPPELEKRFYTPVVMKRSWIDFTSNDDDEEDEDEELPPV